MSSIHVERRASARAINLTRKVKQNEEGLRFYSMKN